MATFHAIEVRRKNLNDEVTETVSKYSESLRNRMGSITDYKKDFDKAFQGFIENSLPQDKLYKMIEKEMGMDKKPGDKSADAKPVAPVKPLLPNVDVSKADQAAARQAKMAAQKEFDLKAEVEEEHK